MSDIVLNREQVRLVDQIAIETYGIPGIVLMENAGRGVAELLLKQAPTGPVTILCGKGNNGGDGFVIARHLVNASVPVEIFLSGEPEFLPADASTNYQIVRKMGLAVSPINLPDDEQKLASALSRSSWIVDALLGTGTTGRAREPFASVIQLVNAASRPVLAVDVPSGLDCDQGPHENATIRAKITATFVAPKPGLLVQSAREYVGGIDTIDIGCPRQILTELAKPQKP